MFNIINKDSRGIAFHFFHIIFINVLLQRKGDSFFVHIFWAKSLFWSFIKEILLTESLNPLNQRVIYLIISQLKVICPKKCPRMPE